MYMFLKRTNRRKTVSFQIKEGYVQVTAPKFLSEKEISKLIFKKRQWIKNKIIFQNSLPIHKPKKFITGETFLYLGKGYKLEVHDSNASNVYLKKDKIIVNCKTTKSKVKVLLEKWYKKESIKVLENKTEKFSKIIGVQPRSIFIKTYTARWGSCSSQGNVIYNWRIVMAPDSVINYVVVHELCHLIHHNHSPNYWNSVREYLPEYKEKINWLKRNSRILKW